VTATASTFPSASRTGEPSVTPEEHRNRSKLGMILAGIAAERALRERQRDAVTVEALPESEEARN